MVAWSAALHGMLHKENLEVEKKSQHIYIYIIQQTRAISISLIRNMRTITAASTSDPLYQSIY